MLYELRIYKIKPKYFPAFLSLTNEHIALRLRHSRLLGYWTTEIGGQNEVVHVWEYDSMIARKRVRDALVQDKDWNTLYMSNMRPMLASQENWLADAASDLVFHPPTAAPGVGTGNSFYRLDLGVGSPSSAPQGTGVIPFASFNVHTGDATFDRACLFHSTDIDAISKPTQCAADGKIRHSRILFPAPFTNKLDSTLTWN